jgi:hypothetical protein
LAQAIPQFEPSHVAWPLVAGAGHAVQRVPHELVLVFDRQRPLQLCVAPVHAPLHAAPESMQTPLQSCLPGHEVPQARPSHVATPPWGTGQAEQDVGPQFATSLLATHTPPHRW